MDRKGGPLQRPASALHSAKINLSDLDDRRAPRPASAPPDSPTPFIPARAREEIQLAVPDRKPSSLILSKAPWEIDTQKLTLRYVIGKGAFGCVYRGIYERQEVAVKLLDWGEGATMSKNEVDHVRASYKQEATMWHNLDHPHITKFVGAHIGETRIRADRQGKEPYGEVFVTSFVGCVVVEYVPNGTLRQYLIDHHEQKISYQLAMRFAIELAKGLSYLHTRNIVHRDVKTDNILLDQYMHVKIIDFGVARVEAKNPKDMTVQTGTCGYMAPEVGSRLQADAKSWFPLSLNMQLCWAFLINQGIATRLLLYCHEWESGMQNRKGVRVSPCHHLGRRNGTWNGKSLPCLSHPPQNDHFLSLWQLALTYSRACFHICIAFKIL